MREEQGRSEGGVREERRLVLLGERWYLLSLIIFLSSSSPSSSSVSETDSGIEIGWTLGAGVCLLVCVLLHVYA